MDIAELLVDAFGRIRETTHGTVDGASRSVLTYRPDPDANTIAWLVWHLARIQDARREIERRGGRVTFAPPTKTGMVAVVIELPEGTRPEDIVPGIPFYPM